MSNKKNASMIIGILMALETHTSLDVLLDFFLDDYWNVDGERELSDAGQASQDLFY